MRFLRQSMIGLFLAAATLGLLIYAVQIVASAVQTRLSEETAAPPPRERVFTVNVVTAELTNIAPVLQSFGEVQSRRTLELRAAVAGRVVDLSESFEDGGRVRAGDVLMRIDPADMQSALDRLGADLADAEAEVREADRALALAGDELSAAEAQATLRQNAYRRQSDLAERGVGTTAAVEEAELAAASARAAVLAVRQQVDAAAARVDQSETRLARAEIDLAEARRDLEDAVLEAPFDGTLSETTVIAGRLVSVNEKVADLIDPDDLEVSFRVSTAQYARLLDTEGGLLRSEVTAFLDVTGVDLQATGRISRVSAGAGAGQTGRLVFARLEQAPGFRPGDFVTVNVREPEMRGVVRLPSSALGSESTLLVLSGADRLESVPVELLRRQGDDVLVRGEGLAGREVVITRSPLLGPGIKVRPVRPEGEAAPDTAEMVELSDERRARLVAFIEGNPQMPEDAKARVLAQLAEPMVPAQMIERIESRIGG
ncbi:efflux RND transporter periplasmic adaptor subunit [Sulfitobacter sp. D35]|uniref:efflux RND transporter periplasmic adaptor subunit n=1 Tax=Sulfitobacter sp. D35 TaxID=3083252 RepID=UPI00296F3B8F|nr:efflux RND transporter periplasmic adaptor subunit [Sulfitobacter sp. D35]MDW4499772.1 efflux RND transporter periplasmic adaptor subunit [Sulfitobacter sp. D35]